MNFCLNEVLPLSSYTTTTQTAHYPCAFVTYGQFSFLDSCQIHFIVSNDRLDFFFNCCFCVSSSGACNLKLLLNGSKLPEWHLSIFHYAVLSTALHQITVLSSCFGWWRNKSKMTVWVLESLAVWKTICWCLYSLIVLKRKSDTDKSQTCWKTWLGLPPKKRKERERNNNRLFLLTA